jgi:hypothetical protein
LRAVSSASKPWFWLGGSDASEEGTWSWLSGERVDMSVVKFGPGEPSPWNNTNSNCMALRSDQGELYDMSCGTADEHGVCKSQCLPYVCHFEEYEYYREARTWHDAKLACESKSMTLASVDTAEEWQKLLRAVSSASKPWFWLGGSDASEEGTWTWLSGERVDMSVVKFGPGEPSPLKNTNQNCMALRSDQGELYDMSCGTADEHGVCKSQCFPYVCQSILKSPYGHKLVEVPEGPLGEPKCVRIPRDVAERLDAERCPK